MTSPPARRRPGVLWARAAPAGERRFPMAWALLGGLLVEVLLVGLLWWLNPARQDPGVPLAALRVRLFEPAPLLPAPPERIVRRAGTPLPSPLPVPGPLPVPAPVPLPVPPPTVLPPAVPTSATLPAPPFARVASPDARGPALAAPATSAVGTVLQPATTSALTAASGGVAARPVPGAAGPRGLVRGVECAVRVQPVYPRRALQEEISGTVVAHLHVNRNGDVGEVDIVSASPRRLFDAAVISAARQYKCQKSDSDYVLEQDFNFSLKP